MAITQQDKALLAQLQQTTNNYMNIYQANKAHLEASDTAAMQAVSTLQQRLNGLNMDHLDTIHGYADIATNEDGGRNKYYFAQEVLAKNEEFVSFMRQFANPDDATSENFGATERGRFADVLLEFQPMSGDDILKIYQNNEGLPPNGAVMSEVRVNGKWVKATLFDGERKDIKDLDKDIRVVVILNTSSQSNDPLENTAIGAILTITHELVIHAESAAERIQTFKTQNQTVSKWKKAIETAIAETEGIFSPEHQQIADASNTKYEKINDKTTDILENDYPNHVIHRKQYNAGWEDEPMKEKTDAKGNPIGVIAQPLDEVFTIVRQSERLDNIAPAEKGKTIELIKKDLEKRKD